jgi:hypothetical protein
MVTLSNLLSELTEVTRNSTTGSLNNTKRTRAIDRVLQDMQDRADWKFALRTNPFYFIDGVTEYSLESYVGATCLDNDGTTSIPDFKNPWDLRIVGVAHNPFGYSESKSVRDNIRRNKTVNEYGIDNGLLIINYPRQTSAQLHNCDSLTTNGTITASGDATNLTIDEVVYSEGSGALNFDVSAGTSLVVTFDGFTAKDLESLQNKSHFTLKAWLPTITNFTSIKLEWGDDVSNNWSKTETVPAGNAELATGENLFAFRWADATETGTPTVTSVNWARVTITYSGATTDTDFRLDDLRVGQELEMELEYFSEAMVKTASGAYQLEFNPTSVTMTDTLLGDRQARRCVIEGAKHECFEIIGGKSERDRTDSKTKYEAQFMSLFKKAGYRIRRASRVLNFPSRNTRDNYLN